MLVPIGTFIELKDGSLKQVAFVEGFVTDIEGRKWPINEVSFAKPVIAEPFMVFVDPAMEPGRWEIR